MELQAPDEESIITVVVTNLQCRFGSLHRRTIEAVVRRVVREVLATANVTSFIGIIAERGAQAELQRTLEVEPYVLISMQRLVETV